MEDTGSSKWYGKVAYAIAGFGIGLLTYYSISSENSKITDVEAERRAQQYRMQEADLTRDGAPDQFYIIDGNVAVAARNGEVILSVLNSLDACVEELESKREFFDDVMIWNDELGN
ncbi:hypothetical protein HYS47_02975 [Candidatus Woesearchaeota archaeon]|nr:hypothetical protein [Candidatus Woesearchaeota archaeon]